MAGRRSGHEIAMDDPFAGVDVDAIIASRRGEKRRRITEVLAEVKFTHVRSSRDNRFAEQFEAAVDEMLIQPRRRTQDDFGEPSGAGNRPRLEKPEGFLFFVTGESGAGKTFMVRRYLERSEEFAPIVLKEGVINPVVSVRAPSPCTLQRLGLRILVAMGDNPKPDLPENRIWERLGRFARSRRVKIVHIDEAQHLARTLKSVNEQQAVANALKDLVESDTWPVSFIMSGIPLANVISQVDEQIERRSFFFALPSLDMEQSGDRAVVREIVERLAGAKAGLDVSNITGSEMLDRLAHAANYQIGRIAQIVRYAIRAALQRDADCLTVNDFVQGYCQHSHARGLRDYNPFLAAHWENLDPGSFIIPEED
ncbi:ATP-binding protein [Mangrovicella endophytica]|uniref:ATP-binding protein n=1 Tax=Mangrovicella endophytica TaxID=2066697 RepID=UPI000C9E3CBD|nr:ATP-binding protein [Mangrovicella endophytica]